jgi:hypothetical protein
VFRGRCDEKEEKNRDWSMMYVDYQNFNGRVTATAYEHCKTVNGADGEPLRMDEA